jgi:hypothetical protein
VPVRLREAVCLNVASRSSSARVREWRLQDKHDHRCVRESAEVHIQRVPERQQPVRGSELVQALPHRLLRDNVLLAARVVRDNAMFREA